MKQQIRRHSLNAGILLWVLAFFIAPAAAQVQGQEEVDDPENLLHYSYSTLLGTGWYKVGDRRVAVLEAPFAWRLFDATDESPVGIRLLLPLAIGFNNFSSEDPIPDDSDDISTISFIPGIEFEIPIGEKWLLRPYGQLGFGTDIDSSENATIYSGGLKARYEFTPLTIDQPGITIGSKLVAAGYSPENGNNDELGLAAFGFDVRFPLDWRIGKRWTWAGLSVYGNYYFTEAEFENFVEDPEKVRSEVTVAVALGGVPDFELWGITFDRIGLGYKRGDGIRAITLATEFPF